MLYFIFVSIFVSLAILDILFGNKFFPSKVEVIQADPPTYANVVKIHRMFFIPIKMYLNLSFSIGCRVTCSTNSYRDIYCFSFYRRSAVDYYCGNAVTLAKMYSNKSLKSTPKPDVILWSSRDKEQKTNTDEQIDELLQQLFKTEEIENKLPIWEKIQKLKNK